MKSSLPQRNTTFVYFLKTPLKTTLLPVFSPSRPQATKTTPSKALPLAQSSTEQSNPRQLTLPALATSTSFSADLESVVGV